MTVRTKKSVSFMAFLLLVLGGGIAIGIGTAPGVWYASLAKPSFNPPNWVFGPVWTVLYIMIAIAGSRIWQRDRSSAAMKLWWVQLLLNFLWSPVFFAAHRMGAALGIIILLLLVIIGFVFVSRKVDRVSAALFLPYVAWVGFASVLNGVLLYLN